MAAFFLDLIIFIIFLQILALLPVSKASDLFGPMSTAFFLPGMFGILFNDGFKGRSFGKWMVGLKVLGPKGDPIGFGESLFRNLSISVWPVEAVGTASGNTTAPKCWIENRTTRFIMSFPDCLKVFIKYCTPAICLCSCAINTANLQTAKSLGQGKVRMAVGMSSGLHLEELSYPKGAADNVQEGGEPEKDRPYKRPRVLTGPVLFNTMFLSAFSLHGGIGIGHGLEFNASVSAALMAASGRIGLKYQLWNHADLFHMAINPTALYAISEGGSGPEDEITDGQQAFLQYVINDKTVAGIELLLHMTWLTENFSYNLAPMLAYYHVNITKAFDPNLTGNHNAAAAGISGGTYLRLGKAAFGPELSLVVLDAFGSGKIVNINYALGVMSDF